MTRREWQGQRQARPARSELRGREGGENAVDNGGDGGGKREVLARSELRRRTRRRRGQVDNGGDGGSRRERSVFRCHSRDKTEDEVVKRPGKDPKVFLMRRPSRCRLQARGVPPRRTTMTKIEGRLCACTTPPFLTIPSRGWSYVVVTIIFLPRINIRLM
jgi:hypothetical protein